MGDKWTDCQQGVRLHQGFRKMLTPAFTLSQEPNYLVIEIKAPYAKVSDAEVFIEECDFKFYSKPYYLRLNLPKPVVEDGRESAKYDTDAGQFTIRVPKATPGEHFEGLDLLTKLLAPTGQTSAKQPLIQVLDGPEKDHLNNEENPDDEEEFDWQIEQKPYTEEDISLDGPKYGFGNKRSGVFKRLQEELTDVIDLKNADSIPASERRGLRLTEEEAKFDEQYYLADLYDNPTIPSLLCYQPPWTEEYKQLKEGSHNDNTVVFTEDEQEKMRKLPRKEYLLDHEESQQTFLGLVDIIFAYAYNHRTTEGENTVESAWTICKLSGTLSWLETYSSLKEAVVASYRRSLCYPLYRHWQLTARVYRDVQRIFAVGRKRLLKCLLETHSMLQASDPRYVLNDLYVTDYCVWIQSASKKQLTSLSNKLQELKVEKAGVGFDLDELETAASLAVKEVENGDDEQIVKDISGLKISAKADQNENEKAKDKCNGNKESAGVHSKESSQSGEGQGDKVNNLSEEVKVKCSIAPAEGQSATDLASLEGAVGFSKESYEKDVLPYKKAAKEANSDSESSDTDSSGDSGDSYSINEGSDLDDSELFQYQSDDHSELDIKVDSAK